MKLLPNNADKSYPPLQLPYDPYVHYVTVNNTLHSMAYLPHPNTGVLLLLLCHFIPFSGLRTQVYHLVLKKIFFKRSASVLIMPFHKENKAQT